MATVKSYNKQTGTTYVYEVLDSKYDSEKGYPVPRRKLIGKIDPITGEVVPTGKRGRPKKKIEESERISPTKNDSEKDYKQLYLELKETIAIKDEYITALESALLSIQSSLSSSTNMCSELLVSLRSIQNDAAKANRS